MESVYQDNFGGFSGRQEVNKENREQMGPLKGQF